MNYTDYAHDFVMEGFNPLPIKANKTPKLPKGHPFLFQAITDIDRLFKDCDKIAIACGDVSGGFYALDFDAHNSEPIHQVLEDFMQTPFVKILLDGGYISLYKTAGGGYHIYFRLASTQKGGVISKWSNNKDVMIELRGNGQYIIVAPSPGYELVDGVSLEKIKYIEKDTFYQLQNLGQSFNLGEQIIKDVQSGKKWPDEWSNSTLTGQFNNEGEETAKELLIQTGWQYIQTRNDNVELWTRPGKDPKDGISATWGKYRNMFYVFTGSSEHFQQEKAYNPFQIYTILKFGGDWKKAKP